MLIIVSGLALAHALGSKMDLGYYDSSANALVGASLMMTGIFIVLGFGLTLSFYG